MLEPIKRRIMPDGRSNKRRTFTSGVYEILHINTRRRYVGSSAEVEKRLYWHVSMLKVDKHHCNYLQNVWNKYVETEFEFFLLEECLKGDLQAREQYHMDSTSDYELMNSQPIALSTRGYKHTAETRAKMSVSAKRASNTPEARKYRSERAKRQHEQGLIPSRPKMSKKEKVCKKCGAAFTIVRIGDYLPQYKMCIECKINYVRRGVPIGYKHTAEAKEKISKASKAMQERRRKE